MECTASVDAAIRVLADPRRLPEWAGGFAERVERSEAAGWEVVTGGRRFGLRVAVGDAGTVDYLREIAPGREGGAYVRAVPRPGGGCVIVMTLPVAPDADPAEVETILAEELDALAALLASA